jgi:hypothetical protein
VHTRDSFIHSAAMWDTARGPGICREFEYFTLNGSPDFRQAQLLELQRRYDRIIRPIANKV